MSISSKDLNTLRALAGQYTEIANQEVMKERLQRYYSTNSLEIVRPVVLINEVPWGEIDDEMLKPTCAPELRGIEFRLRTTIYQNKHFPVDMVVPTIFNIGKKSKTTGIGLKVHDDQIKSDSGTNISSHAYEDMLKTEDDLNKLVIPEISYDEESTLSLLSLAKEIFSGLMPVKLSGGYPSYNIWDVVSRYRGVEPILLDLALRPEFMHQTAEKFCDIAESIFTQSEELGLYDNENLNIHCTVGSTHDLPELESGSKVKRKHTWGRCAAQIFGEVSPNMHDEFDLPYNQKLFGDSGLLYYGCCEPLDRKIDILGKRFPNLRKVSITPWADPDNAAKNIGSKYVMAAKNNPVYVSGKVFNADLVKEEMSQYCRASIENKTPLEFVLKDISTIANKPEHLIEWAKCTSRVIDKFY